MLSSAIKNFLLDGRVANDVLLYSEECNDESESNNSSLSILEELEHCFNDCINQFKAERDKVQQLEDDLTLKKAEVELALERFNEPKLLDNINKYVITSNKIQLMILSNSLEKLKLSQSVVEIPDLILDVIDHVPSTLPKNLMIQRYLTEVIDSRRKEMLADFHSGFEHHLQQTLALPDDKSKMLWVSFLSQSREWLLAYSLLSLLPVSLSDSKSMIMDNFQEVLDEALTPLWSRFYTHLLCARESESFEQILWTFGYTISFITMVKDLCIQITENDKFQKLCKGDYAKVSVKYIVDKAVRFLRAHVAHMFCLLSPMTTEKCMLVVENMFQIDDFLMKLSRQSLTVSAVLSDAHVVHKQFVTFEHSYFLSLLRNATKNPISNSSYDVLEYMFHFPFGDERDSGNSYYENIVPKTGDSLICFTNVVNRHIHRPRRCYFILYKIAQFVILASQRYQYMSKTSQDILNDVVIEPMLCLAVTVMLFKMRSSSLLYALSSAASDWNIVSQGSLSLAAIILKPLMDGHQNFHIPSEFLGFIESLHYFELCLSESCYRDLMTQPKRFEERWSKIHKWVPRRRLNENEYNEGGEFSISKIINVIMSPKDMDEGLSGERSKHGRSVGSTSDILGSAIDLARAQTLTISNVLVKNMRETVVENFIQQKS